jgi:hypothetical protein
MVRVIEEGVKGRVGIAFGVVGRDRLRDDTLSVYLDTLENGQGNNICLFVFASASFLILNINI